MSSKQKQFFDDLFATHELPYGEKAIPIVSDFVDSLPIDYPIIDLGGGDGKHAIFLAKQGYKVRLIDFSQTALDITKKRAVNLQSNIEFIHADLEEYDLPEDKIDGVVCTYLLHFLSNKKATELLRQAKLRTVPGGLHLIAGFLPGGTITKALDQSQITKLYSDWEILQFETKQVKLLQKGSNGEVLFNESFSLAAKKKIDR